jgi:hypothetical protein
LPFGVLGATTWLNLMMIGACAMPTLGPIKIAAAAAAIIHLRMGVFLHGSACKTAIRKHFCRSGYRLAGFSDHFLDLHQSVFCRQAAFSRHRRAPIKRKRRHNSPPRRSFQRTSTTNAAP